MAIIQSDKPNEMKNGRENQVSTNLTDQASEIGIQVAPAVAKLTEQVSQPKSARRARFTAPMGYAAGALAVVATAAAILVTPLLQPTTPPSATNVATMQAAIRPTSGQDISTFSETRYWAKYPAQGPALSEDASAFTETRDAIKVLGQAPAPAVSPAALNETSLANQQPAPIQTAPASSFSETRYWHQLSGQAPALSEVVNTFSETRYWIALRAATSWMATSNRIGS